MPFSHSKSISIEGDTMDDYKIQFVKVKHHFFCDVIQNNASNKSVSKQSVKDQASTFKLLNIAQQNLKRNNLIKEKETRQHKHESSSSFIPLLRIPSSNSLSLNRAESTQIRQSKTPFLVNQEKTSLELKRITHNKDKIKHRICEVNSLFSSKSTIFPKKIMLNNNSQTQREFGMKGLIRKSYTNLLMANRDTKPMEKILIPIEIKKVFRHCLFENKEIQYMMNKRSGSYILNKKNKGLQVTNGNLRTSNYVKIDIKSKSKSDNSSSQLFSQNDHV